MSAPLTDLPSSISSSGHVDGLGRRLLAFDRETGTMMERLYLRPELSAFETALRERVEALGHFEDDRFARPFSVDRDPESGELSVVSEFVAGSRLSDLLETAQDAGVVPGVDVALGFLLEALPALSTLHTTTGHPHGLIDPARLVITPAGQIVFLDCSFGAVIERLGLSRTRLWTELGLASAVSPTGRVSLDVAADIAQAALCAVMLVLGRRLQEEEYPDALPSLLVEVIDVAQIRGSHLFASGLQRLLQRSLPLPGRRPFTTAVEVLEEVRQLLRREIGLTVCHQALVDFTEQMEAASGTRHAGQHEEDDQEDLFADEEQLFADHEAPRAKKRHGAIVIDTSTLAAVDTIEVLDEFEGGDSAFADEAAEEEEAEDEDSLEVEVSLDEALASSRPQDDARTSSWRREPGAQSKAAVPDEQIVITPEPEAVFVDEDVNTASGAADSSLDGKPESRPADVGEAEHPAGLSGLFSRRRKRLEQRSARARKDKLRSTTLPAPAPAPPPPPAKPEPAARPTPSGWLVSPDRAAKFEPPVPDPAAPAAAPIVGQPIAPQPVQLAYAAIPPVAVTPPPKPVVPMPVFGTPPAPPAAPVATPPAAPAAAIQIAPAQAAPAQPVQRTAAGPLRVKAEPPPGYTPPRTRESVSALPYVQRGPMFGTEEPRRFPWKLALVALVIVAATIVIGRAYLPSKNAPPEEDKAVAEAPPQEPPAAAAPVTAATGEIAIETQPAGARVLLDGKPVGESPLKLTAVPAGRHVLTFISPSGEVTKTVRVAAGKTVSMDVPIFSGWVAIFAPILVEISENGRSLGTTEQDRLMLSPGRHELTFVNRDLGYKGVQEVDVEPGEVRSLTLEPKGTVSFNAVPWGEVWLDGQKLGDTPLANMRVALGVREFVFKHPQYGDRRVSATVRGDQPVAVSMDFTRQP